MAKRLLLVITIAVAAMLQLHAINVTTTAGKLATVVTNHNITSLTVSGTIDARDFKFITDELNALKTLNLANANIVAYSSTEQDQLITGSHHYIARDLPYCALAGHIALENLTLPSNLKTIGYGALAGCTKLKAITFPQSLVSIGDDAFNSCSSLTSITIVNRISQLGSKAFAHCVNLTTLEINPYVTLEIGDEAFADCVKLHDVTIGYKVTKIGNGAFNGCTAMKEIYIKSGSQLEDIADMAFYNSGLEKFDFAKTPLLKHLGAWSLARTNLSSLNVPSHVKSLDEGTLFYNKKLTSLDLPKTLSYLPDYMLAGCDALKGTKFMTLKLGSIGDYAIYNQSQHTSITLPFEVYYIGTQAMAGMTGLSEITSEPLEVPELGEEVWAGLDQSSVKLNVNTESVIAYKNATQWMDFIVGAAQLRGDVNGDGFVNNKDATAERLYLVDGNSQGIIIDLTDVNGDGLLNVADIVSVYNIINGSEPIDKPHRRWLIDNVAGYGQSKSSKSVKLDISLDNIVTYTAFQFNISTASYITIDDVELSGRCVGHEIYLKEVAPGQFTILGFSPACDDIEGNSGTLLTLHISSTKPININEKITLDDIIFVDHEEYCYMRNDFVLNLLGVSAVDNIVVDDSKRPVDVYNTQGQLLRQGVMPSQATQGLPAGIYIVGGKKVIVR